MRDEERRKLDVCDCYYGEDDFLLLGAFHQFVFMFFSDDEDADALSVVQPHVEATGKGVGGLSQLMASYGSEDDSCSESDANAAESEACVSDRKPPAVAQSRPCKENNNAGRRSADRSVNFESILRCKYLYVFISSCTWKVLFLFEKG